MNLKRRLITTLPPWALQALSVPYDYLQTTRADRAFRSKAITHRTPAVDAPRHVVVVVVDALRGDAIDTDLTPFLASMAGTTAAVAPSPWTFPSVTSLLTGLYPHEHGTLRADTGSEGLTLPPRLEPETDTLTEVLAGAGYRTYGGFGHDTPFVALAGRFADHALFHNVTATAEEVLADYLSWRDDADADRTFGYVHLADPHQPLDPPREYRERHGVDDTIEGLATWRFTDPDDVGRDVDRYRVHRKALYRATIDYVDDRLAAFRRRLPPGTVMLVTADHGEAQWEHVDFDAERFDGTGVVDHGGTPYEAVARVPFLFSGLDLSTDGYVSLVDIAPTILAAVGLPDALTTTGRSLFEPVPADRIPVVEGTMSGTEKKAVYREGWKLIAAPDAEAWFEVPAEREATPPDAMADALRAALPEWGGTGGQTEVSGLVEQRLQDLGYR